jgi:hypothetical protein
MLCQICRSIHVLWHLYLYRYKYLIYDISNSKDLIFMTLIATLFFTCV